MSGVLAEQQIDNLKATKPGRQLASGEFGAEATLSYSAACPIAPTSAVRRLKCLTFSYSLARWMSSRLRRIYQSPESLACMVSQCKRGAEDGRRCSRVTRKPRHGFLCPVTKDLETMEGLLRIIPGAETLPRRSFVEGLSV
jgi:hypothetical protein